MAVFLQYVLGCGFDRVVFKGAKTCGAHFDVRLFQRFAQQIFCSRASANVANAYD
jgi:hypothetical protein